MPLEQAAASFLADETSTPLVFEGLCGVIERAIAAGDCEQALELAQKGLAMLLARESAAVSSAESKEVGNVLRIRTRAKGGTKTTAVVPEGDESGARNGARGMPAATVAGNDDAREEWTDVLLSTDQVQPIPSQPLLGCTLRSR